MYTGLAQVQAIWDPSSEMENGHSSHLEARTYLQLTTAHKGREFSSDSMPSRLLTQNKLDGIFGDVLFHMLCFRFIVLLLFVVFLTLLIFCLTISVSDFVFL